MYVHMRICFGGIPKFCIVGFVFGFFGFLDVLENGILIKRVRGGRGITATAYRGFTATANLRVPEEGEIDGSSTPFTF